MSTYSFSIKSMIRGYHVCTKIYGTIQTVIKYSNVNANLAIQSSDPYTLWLY